MKDMLIETGDYGYRAVITAAWQPGMIDYLISNNVSELELNTAKGWQRDDLSYLQYLVHLKSFKIIDLAIESVGHCQVNFCRTGGNRELIRCVDYAIF
jgi:hypothetical protein